MSPVETIEAARLFEFIRAAERAVVLVSVHPWQRFSTALGRDLQHDHPELALGAVDLTDLVIAGGPALRFFHQGLYRCGAPTAFGVLPGYYLFRGGQMLAWDAGLPGWEDVAAIARSAVLGAIWSGVTRDVGFVGQALHLAADDVAGQRVAVRFRLVLAQEQQDPSHARGPQPPPPPREDVYWAYQVLGVVPTATDREVHDAWRRKQKESHPDHAASDPAEFQRRTRLSAEINRARDIIVEFRARGARRAG